MFVVCLLTDVDQDPVGSGTFSRVGSGSKSGSTFSLENHIFTVEVLLQSYYVRIQAWNVGSGFGPDKDEIIPDPQQ
jgi:hypothetical protein